MLFDYQKWAIDEKNLAEAKTHIWNWARNAGKTYMLGRLIIDNRPRRVVYVSRCGDFSYLGSKIESIYGVHNFKSIFYSQSKIVIEGFNGLTTTIYSLEDALLPENRDLRYDYILFDDSLPRNTGLHTDRVISTITTNNYNNKLNRLFGEDVCITTIDYKPIVGYGLLHTEHCKDMLNEISFEKFCNEYALNNNPNGSAEDIDL